MSDECKFTQADEGMCSSHNLPAALCTAAAAALQAKVEEAERLLDLKQRTYHPLEARVWELERQAQKLQLDVDVRDVWITDLRSRLSRAEAQVAKVKEILHSRHVCAGVYCEQCRALAALTEA